MDAPLDVLRILAAGGITLLLPGLAWLAWPRRRGGDLGATLAEALCLSLSIHALIALGAFLLGARFSPAGLAGIALLFALLALAGALLGRRRSAEESRAEGVGPRRGRLVSTLALLAAGALLIAWRFYQVRTLVLPAWVDSIHHVLIVRLILERGGLPATFEPYLPAPFYYHFGFHVQAAIFAFWAGLAPERSVLILGQALNAAVALSIYRLGLALWQDSRRAALAALLVGFATQMPAYYATWGRYTLLAGLVLLPVGMATSLEIARQGSGRERQARLAALVAGLLLTHYFAALLLALFLAILAAQTAWQDGRRGAWLRGSRWAALAVAALAGVLLAGAWIGRTWVFAGGSLRVGAIPPSNEAVESLYFENYPSYVWRLLGPARNQALLGLALPGLALAIWRPERRALGMWALALGLMSLPWGLYLAPFRPDHAAIVLFLPAALLLADATITLVDRLAAGRLAWAGRVAAGAALAVLLAWGAWETRSIVNASTVLADRADLRAVQWIESHTAPQSRFFVNVTRWQYNMYRGVDGGWWITPLAGRETLLPPVLYALGEEAYVARVNSLAEQASQIRDCSPEFWELVRQAGLTHLYLHEGHGSLSTASLQDCPELEPIYAEEGVWVYEVVDW